VELVNAAGIPLVARLALAVITDLADTPQPLAFRGASRSESNATRRRLEEGRPPTGPSQGRWGIVSRADPGEPGSPIVVDVARGSPADRAGLRAGDRLQQIDGLPFADQAAMVERLRTAGDSCRLLIERQGRLQEVTLEAKGN
jgi:C-terminal processing protease CtpA/Prc